MVTLCDAAVDVLSCGDATEKAKKTREAHTLWQSGEISEIGVCSDLAERPARPERPVLLPANEMPKRRKAGSDKSKVALLHAIAHIELNAIDLAWDIIARFSHFSSQNADGSTCVNLVDARDNHASEFALPKEFYDDWAKVADDEAKHFLMLCDRMADFGATYGDLPAHDGLWEASVRTAQDFPARLAIVPMVLEARGLDVTPQMIGMMEAQDDQKTADMLRIIHDDEITHVRAGTAWFEAWCAHYGKDVEEYWQHLVKTYFDGTLKRPFNHPSREEAGMIRDWYEPLADISFSARSNSQL